MVRRESLVRLQLLRRVSRSVGGAAAGSRLQTVLAGFSFRSVCVKTQMKVQHLTSWLAEFFSSSLPNNPPPHHDECWSLHHFLFPVSWFSRFIFWGQYILELCASTSRGCCTTPNLGSLQKTKTAPPHPLEGL